MRILMPIDGSGFSKAAVSFVASRTTLAQSNPEIELLNIQYPVPVRAARALGTATVHSYYESEAEKVLKPAMATLKRADLCARARFVVGTVADQLSAAIMDDSADLIVMGSHGRTGLKKLLFGSVTNTVIALSTTPLLVLRSKTAPKKDSLNVAIALDGSQYGIAAVRFFMKHHALFGAAPTLRLLHVVPDLMGLVVPGYFARMPAPSFKPEQAATMQAAAFEGAMAPARKTLKKLGGAQPTEVRLFGNNPGDQIASYARRNKLDLIVMGSHGQGALQSATLGSVSTRVAAQCSVPLLFMRER